jgi:hypothetical protein
MLKRVIAAGIAIVLAGSAAGRSQAKPRWPDRSTPLHSTIGWFDAINAHDRRQLLFYVAPSAKYMMAWARPGVSWSKFTHLRCRRLKTSSRSHANVSCSFHESASPVEGNPDNFWVVEVRHASAGWLIDNYGQG